MDAEKKKPIMIAIAVLCIVLAIVITLVRSHSNRGGVESLKPGDMMWAKCVNPNCEAEYEIEKKEYYSSAQKSPSKTPQCKQCNEYSLFDAVKCPKCGIVFIPGTVRDDVKDRCPECGFSVREGTTKAVPK